jgi:hypothetical protein
MSTVPPESPWAARRIVLGRTRIHGIRALPASLPRIRPERPVNEARSAKPSRGRPSIEWSGLGRAEDN